MKFYYVKNVFDLYTFDNKNTALLNFFEISKEMHFVSLFFLNERSITNSLLMIPLKYAVVHYTNLNSSSINKAYRGPLNMLFRFFRFAIYLHFNEAFVKNFMKKLIIFLTIHFNMQYVYYRILGCQIL